MRNGVFCHNFGNANSCNGNFDICTCFVVIAGFVEDPGKELKADDGVDDDDEDDEEGDVEEGDHGHEDGVEHDLKYERMDNRVKRSPIYKNT